MHRFLFDKRAQFRAHSLVGHQVNRAAEQVFEVELDAEVAFRGGRPIEGNQDVESLSPRAASRAVEPNRASRTTP